MTTTPAIPEPICYAAINKQGDVTSTHKTRDSWRTVPLYALATLQAQPAAVSDEEIDYAVLQAVGFDGLGTQEMNQFDCRHIARAILALRPQSESEARKAAQEQLYTERERHTAEVKRLQAEIGRLQSLRPQAVPMTELPDFDGLPDDAIDNACAAGGIYRADLMRAWESLRADGITAPAGGEG